MRRIAIGFALAALVGLAACAETSSSSEVKTKNSALGGTLVNGEFAPTGGGWVGDGFTLDRGCAANNPVAARPSLGGWTRASLTFGRTASTVRQEVVVPNPTLVTFEVTGNVRPDDPNAWFKIDVNDADEKQTTDRQSGTAIIKPKVFTLSVTTKSPNEKVQIILSGGGKSNWKGCYGPVLTKATLVAGEVVAPTTTTAAPTTTIAPTTTPAPTTTTTIDPNKTCTISWDGTTLVTCKKFQTTREQFFGDDGPLGGQTGGTSLSPRQSSELSASLFEGTKSARISITFVDGSAVSDVDIKVGETINVDFSTPPTPTTLPPACDVQISGGAISTCERIASYEFRWSDGKNPISGRMSTSSAVGWSIAFNWLKPPKEATEAIVNITFTNGKSIRNVKVPLSGSLGTVRVPFS